MPFDTSDLARFQADFLSRIVSIDSTAPRAIRIFHDTWFYGLLDGLRGVYPATAQALGEPAFNAFARDFIHDYPLRSGDQTWYGAEFAAFIAAHPHIGDLAWLGDLALLEWAEHGAHHATDATPGAFEALLDPEAEVVLHPSVRLVKVGHNVDALRDGGPFTLVAGERRWLVGRDRDDVIRLDLSATEAGILAILVETRSLAATLERLSADSGAIAQLQTLLARLVHTGFLITHISEA